MHTTAELRAAFIRSPLLLMGWSFEKAMDCHAIRICLEHLADAKPQDMNRRVIRLPYTDN